MVPTARLELARLSPLPPQDSVSTNSTTSALRKESKICLDSKIGKSPRKPWTLKREQKSGEALYHDFSDDLTF